MASKSRHDINKAHRSRFVSVSGRLSSPKGEYGEWAYWWPSDGRWHPEAEPKGARRKGSSLYNPVGKTYAITRATYALCDPKGQPISLHSSMGSAVGYYASTRRPVDIILDEQSRQRIFAALIRNRYSIRKCHAWVRIGEEKIVKLPPERAVR